jgi:hypothetical protein
MAHQVNYWSNFAAMVFGFAAAVFWGLAARVKQPPFSLAIGQQGSELEEGLPAAHAGERAARVNDSMASALRPPTPRWHANPDPALILH